MTATRLALAPDDRPIVIAGIFIGLILVAGTIYTLVTQGTATLLSPTYLLQRGPYAKNDSDWAEVSAAMGAHARPGDAVVFDEATKPSQRPRLAMHTYPGGFASVADVTLRTPYTRSHGWADTAYSVPTAAALGRFDGVRRVWLVENDIDGALSRYGLADLEAIGFEETGLTVQTHRTLLIELTR